MMQDTARLKARILELEDYFLECEGVGTDGATLTVTTDKILEAFGRRDARILELEAERDAARRDLDRITFEFRKLSDSVEKTGDALEDIIPGWLGEYGEAIKIIGEELHAAHREIVKRHDGIESLCVERDAAKQDTARLDHLVWRCNTWKDNWLDDSLLTEAWNLMESSGVLDGDYHRWVRAAIDADMKRLARRQKRRGQ